jgi:hypothetical protein
MTNSIAGVATAGVSWATCAIVHDDWELDAAGILVRVAEDQREEARLAAAVRSDESSLVARMNGEVRAFQQPLRAARESEVGEPQHRKNRVRDEFP